MALLCSHCGGQYSLHDDVCPDCGQPLTIGAQPAAQPATKQCPYCAETILAAAIKCKHCGERLDVPVKPPPVGDEVKHKFIDIVQPARRPAPEVRDEIYQPSAEPWGADDVAEFYRQLNETGRSVKKPSPQRRGLFARVRSKWPHFLLIGLCVLTGIIIYVAFEENGARYYRSVREQQEILSPVVPLVMFILGELLMWRRRRKKRRM